MALASRDIAPAVDPNARIGLWIVAGGLMLFALWCAWKAYTGIVRRETSFWYRPFKFSYEMPKMLREVELQGWKAVVVGVLYLLIAVAVGAFAVLMAMPRT